MLPKNLFNRDTDRKSLFKCQAHGKQLAHSQIEFLLGQVLLPDGVAVGEAKLTRYPPPENKNARLFGHIYLRIQPKKYKIHPTYRVPFVTIQFLAKPYNIGEYSVLATSVNANTILG